MQKSSSYVLWMITTRLYGSFSQKSIAYLVIFCLFQWEVPLAQCPCLGVPWPHAIHATPSEQGQSMKSTITKRKRNTKTVRPDLVNS